MITVRKMATRRVDKKIDIQNKDDEATVYLYGDIGGFFGIDHLEFIKEFNSIKSKTIHLRVDSGGGDIFAARAIKTAIMQHSSKVIAHIDGLAASAASFLVMGADEIEMVDGGFMMIHNALSFIDVFGYFNKQALEKLVDDMTKEMALHEKLNESIASDYAKKTGKTKEEFLAYMNEETWFDAQQALDVGLIDRKYDGEAIDGKYDLSIYNNVPAGLRPVGSTSTDDKELNERDLEKNLRDVGYSRNQAKNIVAKVFHDERDARSEPVTQDVRDAQNSTVTNQEPTDKKPDGTSDNQIDPVEEAKKLVDPVVDLLNKVKTLTKTEK
jgi:ATP-dependent Clp protease protease subunit